MHDAGMLRLLLPRRFEDAGGLALVGVGLVGRQRRRVERERVKNAGLAIVGIALVQLFHRLFVGDGAGAVIELVAVAVKCGDGRDVVLFAIGLRRYRLGLLDRLGTSL